jgi:hypothetical protein
MLWARCLRGGEGTWVKDLQCSARWSDVGKGPALFVSPIDVYAGEATWVKDLQCSARWSDVGKGPALFVSPVMTETILRPCSGLDVYVGEGTWVKDLQCSLVPYRRTAEGPWLLLVSIRRFYC